MRAYSHCGTSIRPKTRYFYAVYQRKFLALFTTKKERDEIAGKNEDFSSIDVNTAKTEFRQKFEAAQNQGNYNPTLAGCTIY